MTERRMSRQRFVAGAGGAGLAMVGVPAWQLAFASAAGATDLSNHFTPSAQIVAGEIRRIRPETGLTLFARPRAVEVEFAADPYLWRDERVELGAFAERETVVIAGAWKNDSTFAGTAMTNVYYWVRGRVVAIDGDRITVTGGKSFRITRHTRRAVGTDAVAVTSSDFGIGQDVDAIGRRDPQSADVVAIRVFYSQP